MGKDRFKVHKQINDAVNMMLDLSGHTDGQFKQRTTPAQRGLLKVQKVVKEKLYAKYLPPTKRLITLMPNLFHEEPKGPPCLKGTSYERSEMCQLCGRSPFRGWGNAACTAC